MRNDYSAIISSAIDELSNIEQLVTSSFAKNKERAQHLQLNVDAEPLMPKIAHFGKDNFVDYPSRHCSQ